MIRERAGSDLVGCVAVLCAVHERDGYPVNWPVDPVRWLNPPELMCAWVAVASDGAVCGHVAVHRGAGGGAELGRLFVGPAARRRSVARDLVRVVRDWAFQRRYGLSLTVTEHSGRSAAVAFYEASGWTYSHTSDADWTGPAGEPVRLRHYTAGER
ncbi:MAG TPA: GNAT family N-acetyltransferase [Actinoplanes sp.]|nr:GNAT family N-acetyltransferase [Actinoplanes sp.]